MNETASERIDQLQASIVELEQQLAAEKARADSSEQIVVTQQKQIERLIDGRNAEGLLKLKAEAACAEIRNVLGLVDYLMAPIKTKNAFQHALSSDCGNGWLSPEVRKKASEFIEEECDHDGLCLVGEINPNCRKCRILALLDGKEAK